MTVLPPEKSRPGVALAIIAAVNDEQVLAANLAASPCIASGEVRLDCRRGARSISQAYQQALDDASEDWLVFVHQDVYLPANWLQTLHHAVASVEAKDKDWAVIGAFGIGAEGGAYAGKLWSTGLKREVAGTAELPCETTSLDEVLFVLRKRSGLRFDTGLPDFHLYGTDIVMMGRREGLKSYVADLPLIHNSRPVTSLGGGYAKAYRYMQVKWRSQLPVKTTVTSITRAGLQYYWRRSKIWWRWRRVRNRPGQSTLDARSIARDLGYET
jgi:hypothetical protein